MITLDTQLLEKIRKELKKFKKPKSKNKLFRELVFCILVANNNIERTLRVWKAIKKEALKINLKNLQTKLKSLGYRFYRKRAEYIIENRKILDLLDKELEKENKNETREWLVKNIKGLGYKEASHFLRNIGIFEFAILDRHVLKFLLKNKIIKNIPKNLNKRNYLEIEERLKKIAKKLNINLAELDFLIFYRQTGKFPDK